jgi:hypothetical protein
MEENAIVWTKDTGRPHWRGRIPVRSRRKKPRYYFAGRMPTDEDSTVDGKVWQAFVVTGNDEDPQAWVEIPGPHRRLQHAKNACQEHYARSLPELKQCPECGGKGSADSGGSTPWGAWIEIPCTECKGKGWLPVR